MKMENEIMRNLLKNKLEFEDYKEKLLVHSIIVNHAYLEGYLELRMKNVLVGSMDVKLPVRDFYSKIELAYRVGIISVRFRNDLHIIREIRNSFVHYKWNNINMELSIAWDKIKVLNTKLRKSFCGFLQEYADIRERYPNNDLGDVLMIMDAMTFQLILLNTSNLNRTSEMQEESMYIVDYNNKLESNQ